MSFDNLLSSYLWKLEKAEVKGLREGHTITEYENDELF